MRSVAKKPIFTPFAKTEASPELAPRLPMEVTSEPEPEDVVTEVESEQR